MELKSVYVYPKVTRERKGGKNLSPVMILEFGKNKLDIWDGAGLGSPNSETLIKVIDLLYNHSSEWKRNNIIDVFNYLDKKQ